MQLGPLQSGKDKRCLPLLSTQQSFFLGHEGVTEDGRGERKISSSRGRNCIRAPQAGKTGPAADEKDARKTGECRKAPREPLAASTAGWAVWKGEGTMPSEGSVLPPPSRQATSRPSTCRPSSQPEGSERSFLSMS